MCIVLLPLFIFHLLRFYLINFSINHSSNKKMKWGRKKSAPPSSSPISAIARVFPVSWFSKFKQKGGNCESKNKQRCAFDFSTPKSSGWREGRFYSMDEDDAFWRLSFGDDRIQNESLQGRRSTGGINPLWYDSDHEFRVPVSGFKSIESAKMEASRGEECRNFSEMVSDIKKMKEKRGKQRVVAENGGKTGDGKTGVSTRRRKDVSDQVSRKSRVLHDGEEEISNSCEKDIFPIENMVCERHDSWKSQVSDSRKLQKSPTIDLSPVPEWHEFGERKLEEIRIKTESKKKSASVNRGLKSYSPRTECKIRALEEMKRARMKTKKKERKEQVLEGNTVFDSFAVVKRSYDPQRDFRHSMIEMIRERGIGQPEDLEELLACYLTLNCDEYHDLIIKVFREVWLELKGVYIDPPITNGAYFDYLRID